ncbi:MAG TPA: LuxR C-terminal-related transcriptional regulator [Dehalococcoidia bacterium]|nr:LuxR C-terminal-related transcriptional regulator [Dehalococcoidia bacterium]
MNPDELLQRGREALSRGDWAAARGALQDAVATNETPQALEDLGTALWWLDDQNNVLETREAAFRAYRAAGDDRSAARLATLLALDYVDYRNDIAAGNGWMQRAEHLLERLPNCDEHAWLHLYNGLKALMFDGDVEQARQRRDTARALARELNNRDVEMMVVGLDALLLIREGKFTDGMLRLDEAMTAAVGGEMSDLPAIGNTCCFLLYACEAVGDYDRAAQWCERTREFCRRMGMDAFFAICRNYYATVLIWKGDWDEADAELSAALRELQVIRPGYAKESLAKLGELRRKQGRLEAAEALFRQADPHRLSLMGRAGLALDRADPQAALDFLDRQIRRIGDEDIGERAFALALRVTAQIMAGDPTAAAGSLADLETAVSLVGTQPLRATVNGARGALARTLGQLDKAKLHYEDAIDLFEASAADFDAARLRLELAGILRDLDRGSAALEQVILAQGVFKRLGAAVYAERAASIIASLAASMGKPPSDPLPYDLTPREGEVLWLIAAGKTNQEIADDLVLSIRTVERHISTVYEKLNLHGRAARASAAAIAVSLRPNT